MQIILLEKVVNLGNLGDIVKVKDGYARNFLILAVKHAAPLKPTNRNLKRAAWSSKKQLQPNWAKHKRKPKKCQAWWSN